MKLSERVALITRPDRISEALYANSAAVLEFAFQADPNVRELIAGGREALPIIEREIRRNGRTLHDISLACLVHILSIIDVKDAARIVRPIFPTVVKRPGSFAATFLARALRMAHHLPVGSGELHFTPQELQETLKVIET